MKIFSFTLFFSLFLFNFIFSAVVYNGKSIPIENELSLDVINVNPVLNLDMLTYDDSGNWHKKKMIYIDAQALYEKILNLLTGIEDIKSKFLLNSQNCYNKLDKFYENFNFDKGKIDEWIKLNQIKLENEKQKRGGDLSEKERQFQVTLENETSTIDEIAAKIEHIYSLDKNIDKTISTSYEAIKQCNDFGLKAWDNFKLISETLNDKEAEKLYKEMENFFENINVKINYLNDKLLSYMDDQLIGIIESTINSINQSVESLKNKEIDLNKILSEDFAEDLKVEEEREEFVEQAAEAVVEKKAIEKIDAKEVNKKVNIEKEVEQAAISFLDKIIAWFKFMICKVIKFFEQFKCIFCSMFAKVKEFFSKYIK